MDLESRIINKIDNAENSKLLSLCCRSSLLVSRLQFESISSKYIHMEDEADLIIGLFIYEIRVVTRAMMIEVRWDGVLDAAALLLCAHPHHSFHLTPLSSLLFISVIQSLCFKPLSIFFLPVSNLPSIENLFSYRKTQNYPNIQAHQTKLRWTNDDSS